MSINVKEKRQQGWSFYEIWQLRRIYNKIKKCKSKGEKEIKYTFYSKKVYEQLKADGYEIKEHYNLWDESWRSVILG